MVKSDKQKLILRVARDVRKNMMKEFGEHFLTIRECVESAEDAVSEYMQG
jgi:hypothetical protein